MLSDFLQGFSASTAELVIFIVMVLAYVGGLTWFAVASQWREDRRQLAAAERRFDQLVETMRLSPADCDTLETLSDYLRHAGDAYLLLQNHTVFDCCVESALAAGTVSEGDAEALRTRLGFSGEPVGAEPESSTEIPVGSGVAILDIHDRALPGRLIEHTPSSFTVRTAADAAPLMAGSPVEIVYQNGSGIYRFESEVLANAPGEIELSHSERLERVQRREHSRGQARLPVYVKLACVSERPQQTQLIDVHGGYASFQAPDPRFQRREHVELTFHPDSEAPLHLTGRIVREFRGGRIVQASFDVGSRNEVIS